MSISRNQLAPIPHISKLFPPQAHLRHSRGQYSCCRAQNISSFQSGERILTLLYVLGTPLTCIPSPTLPFRGKNSGDGGFREVREARTRHILLNTSSIEIEELGPQLYDPPGGHVGIGLGRALSSS